MPISKSAKKSLKVSLVKRDQNRKQEIVLSKALKSASEKNINEVMSKIDKAAKTGIISKNKAARFKSRLGKKFGTPKGQKQNAKVKKQKVTNKEIKPKAKISSK